MAKHDVTFTLPERPPGKVDIDFTVMKDSGTLGTLKLSKGGVDWVPKNARGYRRLSWTKLAALMEEHGKEKI